VFKSLVFIFLSQMYVNLYFFCLTRQKVIVWGEVRLPFHRTQRWSSFHVDMKLFSITKGLDHRCVLWNGGQVCMFPEIFLLAPFLFSSFLFLHLFLFLLTSSLSNLIKYSRERSVINTCQEMMC
jgi:hypothetical protein